MAGRKGFKGGYKFKRFEGQPLDELNPADLPTSVLIPLVTNTGVECSATVAAGDSVKAGQSIAADSEGAALPVLATINGTVKAISDISGLPETSAVVIESDGSTDWQTVAGSSKDWQSLSADQVDAILYDSGASSLCRNGIPTRKGKSAISPDDVEHIIVSAGSNDIYSISAATLVAGDGAARACNGMKILKKAFPNASVHIALGASLSAEAASTLSACAGVAAVSVSARYPQHSDEILVETVLGRPFPHGYDAENIGVVVIDLQAAQQVCDAVTEGKPVIERIVAICGSSIAAPAHSVVRIGTPIADVVSSRIKDGDEARVILNSVMTGDSVSDLSVPVERSLSCLIALHEDRYRQFMAFVRPGFADDGYSRTFVAAVLNMKKKAGTNLKGEPRPCVSCGFCQEVCPAGVIPHLLYKYAERGMLEEILVRYRIFNCIGCNLCSYVCPSKIAVGKYITGAQEQLAEEGVTNLANLKPIMKLKGLES